jgi:S-adenosylmethionine:tRNA ribosyltransferase-isomerase
MLSEAGVMGGKMSPSQQRFNMKREDLFFDLPKELIAQEPVEPRDACKLMVLNKNTGAIQHERFFDLGSFLQPGDVLVFNESKVLPARLIGTKGEAKKEVLLLKELGKAEWEVLIGGKIKEGDVILFKEKLFAEVLEKSEGTYKVKFSQSGPVFLDTLFKIGLMPTPPYMKQLIGDNDKYQTVYAKELGSAAAPTAGLHFTDELLEKLKAQGVQQEFVTLHVGLGTFQPIKSDIVEEHAIHSEYYEVKEDVYARLKQAKEEGRRIIAVGTTSIRVLETIFSQEDPKLQDETKIFIYPGYSFKAVDGLITNFHTPYSSLLALVYALAGESHIKQAYQEAISENYRFFSFGDAMLIQ